MTGFIRYKLVCAFEMFQPKKFLTGFGISFLCRLEQKLKIKSTFRYISRPCVRVCMCTDNEIHRMEQLEITSHEIRRNHNASTFDFNVNIMPSIIDPGQEHKLFQQFQRNSAVPIERSRGKKHQISLPFQNKKSRSTFLHSMRVTFRRLKLRYSFQMIHFSFDAGLITIPI